MCFASITIQQNATAVGALPRIPLGSLQRSPDPMGVLQVRPSGRTQNFDRWAGWALILFANLLKLVPPHVGLY